MSARCVRRQLVSRAAAVNDPIVRRTLILGTQHLSRRDLEELRDAGQMIELRVLGWATIADDVTAALALATVASVEVIGAFRAPRAVKAASPPAPSPEQLPHSPARRGPLWVPDRSSI
ncbi:MAG TPA: hypothetical protein VF788_08525 [Pseudonocardiaceae bacterium]